MGDWRGKYLDTGPPRGPGHYSQDGRWWWDEDQRRWFRTAGQEDVLEIQAEDMGGASLAASLLTTVSSQYGNGYFRFVARARSADPRWPTYAVAGATFPAARPSLEDVGPRAPGSRTSGSDSTSSTGSSWPRAGGRRATGPTGGRPSTGGRTWTGIPPPTPSQHPAAETHTRAGTGGGAMPMHAGPARRAAAAAVAAGTALAGYVTLVRPKILRWGANDEEAAERLPGDEVVAQPRYQTTHAVTIKAPPRAVWPWLVQLGQGRGGLYSYDWLENLFGLGSAAPTASSPTCRPFRSATRCGWPPGIRRCRCGTQVLDLQPPQALVLGPHGDRQEALAQGLPWPTWTFVLRELGDGATRLIVRMRSDFKPTPLGVLANKYALEPVHFAMERKMLLGIKDRAEQAAER